MSNTNFPMANETHSRLPDCCLVACRKTRVVLVCTTRRSASVPPTAAPPPFLAHKRRSFQCVSLRRKPCFDPRSPFTPKTHLCDMVHFGCLESGETQTHATH